MTVRMKLKVARSGDSFSDKPGDVVTMDLAEARRHVERDMAELAEGEVWPEEESPAERGAALAAAAPETAAKPQPQTAAKPLAPPVGRRRKP